MSRRNMGDDPNGPKRGEKTAYQLFVSGTLDKRQRRRFRKQRARWEAAFRRRFPDYDPNRPQAAQ